MWLVVGIETAVAWPTNETRIRYRGYEIILRPATDQLAPSVVMEYHPPTTMERALVVARQFLSALAWVEGMPIREIMVTGGTVAIGVGRGRLTNVINPHFCVDYLPEPQDPKAHLALALYREALNINSIAYQFLGFFKAINVLYKTGGDQKNWINTILPGINDHRALERLTVLKQEQSDIGQYLYESGRCAIAHAYDEPLVDPEDPEDNTRLARDLPVIRALAEFLIEHELGIKSQHAVWQEHLYELDGFRGIVGVELVERLKSGASIDIRELPPFPRISIRLREQLPLANFEDMASEPTYVGEGRIVLRLTSRDGTLIALLGLDFAAERLIYDPIKTVAVLDDGSVRAAHSAIDRIKLLRGLILNGQLEAWDSEHAELLGRCDPHIPLNIDLERSLENLDRIQTELESEGRRRSADIDRVE